MSLSANWLLLIGGFLLLGCNKKIINESTIPVTPEVIVQPFEEEEIVLQGTVIAANRGFYQNNIYSSCVIEINTIFKGRMEESVIEIFVFGGFLGNSWSSVSHGQMYLPPVNTTAIFRIKEIAEGDSKKKMQVLTPFKLYGMQGMQVLFPNGYVAINKNINLEKELYQDLEREFGTKRKSVIAPATIDEVAINYSTKNNLLVPNRLNGIVYKLLPIQETKYEDYIGFSVNLASTNAISYYQQGELLIAYNKEAFGDSIITRENLLFNIPRNYRKPGVVRNGALPDYFKVTVEDIASDTFMISWENESHFDSCLQLLPHERGRYVAELFFKPINHLAPVGIKLSSPDATNLRYDYEKEEMVPFEYAATQEIQGYQVLELMPATIDSIYPEGPHQPFDTIQLVGKNFGRFAKVALRGKGTRGHIRHRKVPDSRIVSRSDTLITLVIPPNLVSDDDQYLSEEWIPVSGKIRLTKGYGQFEVDTYSEQKLILASPNEHK